MFTATYHNIDAEVNATNMLDELSKRRANGTFDWKVLGVPVTAAAPAETGQGIGWLKMGPAEPLLPFAVRHAVKLSSADLESLCCDFKVPVVMLPGERGVTMRANAVVLVNYLSPHESVATRIDIVESILGERRVPA